MSIMSFVGLDMLMGLDTPKLIVPTEFKVFDLSPNLVCVTECLFASGFHIVSVLVSLT